MQVNRQRSVLMLLENESYPRDRRVRREAEALVDAGYQVSVIAPGQGGQRAHEQLNRVSVYRYPAPPDAKGALGYFVEYAYAMTLSLLLSLVVLIREGFDVIHAHNPPDTFVLIGALYKLLGKRFVFDHHDLSPEMYQARFPHGSNARMQEWLIALEKLSCRVADHVIATNESYKKIEMARSGIPSARITVVRNGPQLDNLPQQEPDTTLRQRAEWIIGYIGVIGVQDGVDYLVRALHHLVHDLKRMNVLGLVVGDGAAQHDLKRMANELHLDDHLVFTGWVEHDQLARYAHIMDICVAPEPSNTYNDHSTVIKLMDYMALGKPIVAFDLPEHRATAEGAALFVHGNDALALARAIAELMDHPDEAKEMAARGRRRAENELAWRHSVPKLIAAYEKLFTVPQAVRAKQGKSVPGL